MMGLINIPGAQTASSHWVCSLRGCCEAAGREQGRLPGEGAEGEAAFGRFGSRSSARRVACVSSGVHVGRARKEKSHKIILIERKKRKRKQKTDPVTEGGGGAS